LLLAVLLNLGSKADYVFSSIKLEKRAKQVLPGSEGGGRRGRGWGEWGEMAQTMYAHLNK
jgi:hypothetical protein